MTRMIRKPCLLWRALWFQGLHMHLVQCWLSPLQGAWAEEAGGGCGGLGCTCGTAESARAVAEPSCQAPLCTLPLISSSCPGRSPSSALESAALISAVMLRVLTRSRNLGPRVSYAMMEARCCRGADAKAKITSSRRRPGVWAPPPPRHPEAEERPTALPGPAGSQHRLRVLILSTDCMQPSCVPWEGSGEAGGGLVLRDRGSWYVWCKPLTMLQMVKEFAD